MTHRNRLTIARLLVLALMFRVGLGFGHGPMVASDPNLMLQGYCGELTESTDPDMRYQGCPICHALSYQADIDHGLIPASPQSEWTSLLTAAPPPSARTSYRRLHGIIHPPRAPPFAGTA